MGREAIRLRPAPCRGRGLHTCCVWSQGRSRDQSAPASELCCDSRGETRNLLKPGATDDDYLVFECQDDPAARGLQMSPQLKGDGL